MQTVKLKRQHSPISLQEILLLNDEAFVSAAYLALLGRKPDNKGVDFYLARLRAGHSKEAVLREIATSSEAKRQGRALPGLSRLILIQNTRRGLRTLFNRQQGHELMAAIKMLQETVRKSNETVVLAIAEKSPTQPQRNSPELPLAPMKEKQHDGSVANRYIAQVLSVAKRREPGFSTEYVPRQPMTWRAPPSKIRAFAFYLPQFHPIPENDKWWGKGFTEWTNVSKAAPQFVGHYQPHLPGELGFYDLRLTEVLEQQAELARQYGIEGFCFHYYWFGGRRLLEAPLNKFLENSHIDLSFCLCWANENWSRRWDGGESDILMAQKHSPEDDIALLDDIAQSFKDPRYLTIDGRPVFIVYRVSLLPDPRATAARWRARCKELGIADPYLVAARSFEVVDPRPYGFDAAVEFPPHQIAVSEITEKMEIVNPDYRGKVYDYRDFSSAASRRQSSTDYLNFRGIMPSWDNEARKPGLGHTFAFSSPSIYARWLRDCCEEMSVRTNPDERLLFINAWNEWGEGAHLEPDRRYGYSYLHTTANVLGYFGENLALDRSIKQINERFQKSSDVAVVLHLYYDELFDEILSGCLKLLPAVDVYLSVSRDISLARLGQIVSHLSSVKVVALNNVGRDIWPFLVFLPELIAGQYKAGLKIHSKRSLHTTYGGDWFRRMLASLCPSEKEVRSIIGVLGQQDALHVLAPSDSLIDLSEPDRNVLNRTWLDDLLTRLGRTDLVGNYKLVFPAGSMYWFKPSTFSPLASLKLSESDFEPELGQIDGTLAHAVERLVGLCTILSCGQCKSVDNLTDGES